MKKLKQIYGIIVALQLVALAVLIFTVTYYKGLDAIQGFILSIIAYVVLLIPSLILGVVLLAKRAKPYIIHVPLAVNMLFLGYLIVRFVALSSV